jgi:hypothetical protein
MQGRQSPMTRSRARPCPCRPLALQAQFGRRQAEADHWEDYGDLRLCDCFPVSVKTGLPWFAAGGNFQDLSGVFEAGHHRDVPSSPPKAAKLTFPMSLGPDGGLPRGPVESRTKHHYVCSGCLIDRLGSGLRHGGLHRLTMEKVTALKCYPSPRCSAHCEAHGHMANGFGGTAPI